MSDAVLKRSGGGALMSAGSLLSAATCRSKVPIAEGSNARLSALDYFRNPILPN